VRTINGDGHLIELIDVTHRSDGMTEVTFVDRNNDKVWTEDVRETVDLPSPTPTSKNHQQGARGGKESTSWHGP
jgi:hypothetical protein